MTKCFAKIVNGNVGTFGKLEIWKFGGIVK